MSAACLLDLSTLRRGWPRLLVLCVFVSAALTVAYAITGHPRESFSGTLCLLLSCTSMCWAVFELFGQDAEDAWEQARGMLLPLSPKTAVRARFMVLGAISAALLLCLVATILARDSAGNPLPASVRRGLLGDELAVAVVTYAALLGAMGITLAVIYALGPRWTPVVLAVPLVLACIPLLVPAAGIAWFSAADAIIPGALEALLVGDPLVVTSAALALGALAYLGLMRISELGCARRLQA